jgi:hypothetical protein
MHVRNCAWVSEKILIVDLTLAWPASICCQLCVSAPVAPGIFLPRSFPSAALCYQRLPWSVGWTFSSPRLHLVSVGAWAHNCSMRARPNMGGSSVAAAIQFSS